LKVDLFEFLLVSGSVAFFSSFAFLGGILVRKQEGSVREISRRWCCGLSEVFFLKN